MDIYFIGEKELLDRDDIHSSTIEECYEYLMDKKEIGLDIETTKKIVEYEESGLDPYTSKIVMLQIGDLERQYIIDHRIQDITILLPLLTDTSIVKVGHNLKFEYKHILHNYKIKINNIYDTQIAEQILYCGYPDKFVVINDKKVKRNSLEALIYLYCKKYVEKTTRLEFLKIGSKPFSTKQIYYGAEDIIYPLEIKKIQEEKLLENNLQGCMGLEMKFLPVLGDIEYKGMNFNKDKWLEIYNRKKPLMQKQEEVLNQFVIKYYANSKFINRQMDLFNPDLKCDIQWTSSTQVIKFLRHLDACPQEISKTTKKLAYTANGILLQASLNGINKDKPEHIKTFIKEYVKFKEFEQSCTTFGKDFFKYINPITKRVHTNFKQILNTGRISSTNPNLQNIPSEQDYRKCFDAPDGCDIVNADYSGQEQIVLVNKANDPGLIKFYTDKLGDMHSYVASKIFSEISDLPLDEIKNKHKDKRQIAKSAGFAINYGGNGYTIAKNLGITTENGENVYNAYFDAFPGLKNYFSKVQKEAIGRGYILIDEVTGRKSYFKRPNTPKEKHAIFKKALNYPIQGESGSITKYAAILFRRWLIDSGNENNIFITNLVHDEINLECKTDYSKLASEQLEKCMKEAADIWCKTIPMEASAVITKYWGH